MTIVENISEIYEDEKRTRKVQVKTWEISGCAIPREKNVPVALRMSGCPTLFLCVSHQDADVFLAVPITLGQFLRLKWHRMWN